MLGVISRNDPIGAFSERNQDFFAGLEIQVAGEHLALAIVDLHQDAGVIALQDFHTRDLLTLDGAAQIDLSLFNDFIHLCTHGLRPKSGHLCDRQLYLREVGQEQECGDDDKEQYKGNDFVSLNTDHSPMIPLNNKARTILSGRVKFY